MYLDYRNYNKDLKDTLATQCFDLFLELPQIDDINETESEIVTIWAGRFHRPGTEADQICGNFPLPLRTCENLNLVQ